MSAMVQVSPRTIAVPEERVIAFLKWVPVLIWAICIGGMWMGFLVSRADELRSAKYTMLGGLPGWPEVWGLTLMVLGAVSIIGRLIGTRVLWRRARLDGIAVATAAMWGMSFWYSVFAASLWLGTAAYAYAPYLTLSASHVCLGALLWATQGVRLHPPQVTSE